MCLNPIKIRNKSKYRSLDNAEMAYYTVPCGKCAECRKSKAMEYTARSYAQYIYTEKQGGFSYFETLTYAPEYLPTLYGMPCFDSADYKKFFKRLRKNIDTYKEIDVDGNVIQPFKGLVAGNLKYFFASEYGGKTHRPHYHVIFYVTIPGMDLIQFRNFVADAWYLGFIDRIYTVRQRKINGIGAMHYVSEYVNKDYEFMKVLDAKIKDLEKKEIYLTDEELKRFQPFHRQSKGYGIDIINQNDYDYMFNTGMIRIPDKKHTWREIPIPMYIKRKLFYDKVENPVSEWKPVFKRNSRGEKEFVKYDFVKTYTWRLNDEGIKYKLNRLNSTIDLLAKRYESLYRNMDSFMKDSTKEEINILRNTIDEYLKTYTYYDLAIYNSFYKDRMFTQDMDIYEIALADCERPRCERPYYYTGEAITKKVYLPQAPVNFDGTFNFSLRGINPDANSPVNRAIQHPNIKRIDSEGEYALDVIGKDYHLDGITYKNHDLEMLNVYFANIMNCRNEALNKTYFAKVEYLAKKKALKSA